MLSCSKWSSNLSDLLFIPSQSYAVTTGIFKKQGYPPELLNKIFPVKLKTSTVEIHRK